MTKKKTKVASVTPLAPRSIEELKAAHKAYMLHTCRQGMTSYGGFVWPKEGLVEAPDWNPGAHCGNGLHGLLWGAGEAGLLNWDEGAPWLVVGIDEWVDLGGKVKTPRGEVVHVGDMRSCADLLVALGADPGSCVGGTATAGVGGTATAGVGGVISIHYYDAKRERYCVRIGYIGEDGLEVGQLYQLDGDKFVPAEGGAE